MFTSQAGKAVYKQDVRQGFPTPACELDSPGNFIFTGTENSLMPDI